MADDLNQPFIGYRSAGRRRAALNDRRASADAPLALLRGIASGVLGAPGDIESLVRMLPGLSEQTVLPTSRDVEARLPLRGVSQTPFGRAATELGTLGGGFYTGPGSPLRAIAGLPSAVSRAGRDFAMAAGQPAVNVVKPKGGNWLAGSVERAIEPMIPRTGAGNRVARDTLEEMNRTYPSDVVAGMSPETRASIDRAYEWLNPNVAMQDWLEKKLAKYMRNEMATPEDPIRALAEKGVLHTEVAPTSYYLKGPRAQAGFPEEGMGVSPLAKAWEDKADTFINDLRASDITQGYPGEIEKNPWLLKVPPETRVYDMLRGSDEDLGFGHLADELRNAINPASGLPENLRWKYSDLDKVTVPQAVERVAKINEWRAAQKAEADLARAMGPATQVVKEYPEQGFKWVELRQPKETGRKVTVEKSEMDLPPDMDQRQMREVAEDMAFDEGLDEGTQAFDDFVRDMMTDFNRKKKVEIDESYKALEDALKYEGEVMKHCVGGYCPDVIEGRSKIFSLRDKKGQPHVTIEVAPPEGFAGMRTEEDFLNLARQNHPESIVQDMLATARKEGAFTPSIVQIKGKANRAPNPEYLPAVQDFVRSGNWGRVGDLQNTGLVQLPDKRFLTTQEFDDALKQITGGDPSAPSRDWFLNVMRGDPSWWEETRGAFEGLGLNPAARGEGFAAGGLVANSPTGDFDPARIDAIVGDLHALNAQ